MFYLLALVADVANYTTLLETYDKIYDLRHMTWQLIVDNRDGGVI